MEKRTSAIVIRFQNTFCLPGFDKPQPAGDYHVEHEEEAVGGVTHLAWRRIGTSIHVPAIGVESAKRQIIPIEPADLDSALARDDEI